YKCAQSWQVADVNPKAGASIDALLNLLRTLKEKMLNDAQTPGTVLLAAMEEIGYRKHLTDISKDQLAGQKRWSLVEAYARFLDRFIEKRKRKLEAFDDFITSLELKDHEEEDGQKDEVQLMTLHACKG